MLSLYGVKAARNRLVARPVLMAIVIAALMVLPLALPGGGSSAAAQTCFPGILCPNGQFNVAALVSRIDVTWTGGHHWVIKFNLASGVNTTGNCGDGSAVYVQTTDSFGSVCGSGSTDVNDAFALDVNVGTCNGNSFTVGYKVNAYQGTTSGRVHSNVTINKSDFTVVNQTITGYAPVPGC